MDLYLSSKSSKITSNIAISGSKSESNRLLILQQFFNSLVIENLSDSDDSKHLSHALTTNEQVIDIGHAGTAMRFLTGYFATQNHREVILTGSERMQNRPIEILVNALNDLGASISYEDKIGYPPIRIKGTTLTKNKVEIQGNVSSQYISSLLLIAPSLANGLEIKLIGEITSIPYINMTLKLLNELDIKTSFKDAIINIAPFNESASKTIVVESDWSSASYFYSLIALSDLNSSVELASYKKESLQGDSCLVKIYEDLGVSTTFNNNKILLKKTTEISNKVKEEGLVLDLANAPDIAQTIAVSCFGLGISCKLTGLHTLKIKETDRLVALQNELTKLGASISITENSLSLESSSKIEKDVAIETYNDHRMAMAFAPLSLKTSIKILDAEVVTKSYRNFWEDMKKIGIITQE